MKIKNKVKDNEKQSEKENCLKFSIEKNNGYFTLAKKLFKKNIQTKQDY